jgi:hypothetical protein
VLAASATGNGAQQPGKAPVNELLPFLDFVERHPVGTGCTAVVESYASHGANARAGDVLVYVPLRLMGEPPPRSARAALKIGEAVAVVIVGYVPERRSIDAALVSAGAVDTVETPAPTGRRRAQPAQPPAVEPAVEAPPRKRRTAKAKAAAEPPADAAPAAPAAPDARPPAKRTRRAAEPAIAAAEPEPAPKPTRKRAAKPTEQPAAEPAKRPARARKAPPPTLPEEQPKRKRAAKPKSEQAGG